MSKLPNIIQRRELEPLLVKALKIVKHYEKATNCTASVMEPDSDISEQISCPIISCSLCKKGNAQKDNKTGKTTCCSIHIEAVKEAKRLGKSYIYHCPEGFSFWACPFYSGERFAGAFISGGIRESTQNVPRVKALASIMLLCADRISRGMPGMIFSQQNLPAYIKEPDQEIQSDKTTEKSKNNISAIDMERNLFANLRRGDNKEANKILLSLLNVHHQEVKFHFPAFRLKALELAVLLSRAASEPDNLDDKTVMETNNRYLMLIEASLSFQEITEMLSNFIEKIAEKIFSFHGVRHFPALRKAERFIWENYTRKISLQEIANASGLSAPYFSTIFKEEMGENLSNYLNRLRVEKAASLLATTNMPISEIAKTCGFEDQSWFSKIFKNNTGLTPGKFRDQGSISGISA